MSALAAGAAAGVLAGAALAVLTAGWRRADARRCLRRLPAPATGDGPSITVVPPRLDAPAWLLPHLVDAALPVPPGTVWSAWVLVTAPACAGALVLLGPGPVVLLALAATGGLATVLVLRRGSAGRVLDAALPDALEAVARGLRSGAGPAQALAEVASGHPGPLGDELRRVAAEVRAGATLAAALEGFATRRPLPGVRLAVAALLLGAEAGGASARALDGVAASIRARSAVGREVRALSSQVRLSALVIAAAPLAFAALAAGTDAGTASFLLGTPAGLACLAGGLVLDAAGACWMHRLSQVDA